MALEWWISTLILISINAVLIAILIIFRKRRRITKEQVRKWAKEIEEGPITLRDIKRRSFGLKLARKYGPAKAVLICAIIIYPTLLVVLFPLFTIYGFTPIETVLGVSILVPLLLPFGLWWLYHFFAEAVRYSESESNSERDAATTGDENGKVDT